MGLGAEDACTSKTQRVLGQIHCLVFNGKAKSVEESMQVKGRGGKTDQSSRVNSGRPVKTNYIVCTGELATSL